MVPIIIAAAVFCAPALPMALAALANRRAGELGRQRELCGRPLPLALLRAGANAVRGFWRMVFLLPRGRFAPYGLSRAEPDGTSLSPGVAPPPVLLVHGLYHDPSAWTVLTRRLRAAGYPEIFLYRYPSFGRSFAAVAGDLATAIRGAADPEGRIFLVGHSLGGLLVRAAAADPRLAAASVRPAGIVTLGAPHGGSRLAGIGPGRLARELIPGGTAQQRLHGTPPAGAPGLSLFSPTDDMVHPLSGSLLDAETAAAGWRQECLSPLSHVGLLYDRDAARRIVDFFREAVPTERSGDIPALGARARGMRRTPPDNAGVPNDA